MFFVVQAVLVLTLEATLTLAEIYIFFYQAFLSSTFANHRTAGERGGDFLDRYLDISRPITAESSPLQIGSSRTRTGNLWFPSVSR